MSCVTYLFTIILAAYCVDYAVSCSCLLASLQMSFCSKSPEQFIYRGIPTERKLINGKPDAPWDEKFIYDVQVVEVFKKPEGSQVSAGSVIQLTTNAVDAACGGYLDLRVDTLVTGYGNWFSLCDYKAVFSSLTESEVQGLKGGYICN